MKPGVRRKLTPAQSFDQSGIDFHRPHSARPFQETPRQKTQSRTDLDDVVVPIEIEQTQDRLDHALMN
jgi:hypothetical protein